MEKGRTAKRVYPTRLDGVRPRETKYIIIGQPHNRWNPERTRIALNICRATKKRRNTDIYLNPCRYNPTWVLASSNNSVRSDRQSDRIRNLILSRLKGLLPHYWLTLFHLDVPVLLVSSRSSL